MPKKKKNRSNTIYESSEVDDGYVIKRFESGDRYEGYYSNGKRNGKGTYIWSSGDKYVGDWTQGLFNGVGTLQLRTGDSFQGSFLNGTMHGIGLKINARDGSVVEGMFCNGKAHGFCKKQHSNGDTKNGFFVNDVMNGYGEYKWNDGSMYCGNWNNDYMEGIGIKTFSQDAIKQQQGLTDIVTKYEGNFTKNLFNGLGSALYSTGEKYSGNWKDSKRSGWGRLEFSDGLQYNGNFLNNRFHGRGCLEKEIDENLTDLQIDENTIKVQLYIQIYGGEYRGEFYYGKASGYGILTLINGKQIKGIFKNDCIDIENQTHPFYSTQ